GENPHQWYAPETVRTFIARVTDDLGHLDSKHAAYYERRRRAYESTALERYTEVMRNITQQYAGTPVGATESIFAPLASALAFQALQTRQLQALEKALAEGTQP